MLGAVGVAGWMVATTAFLGVSDPPTLFLGGDLPGGVPVPVIGHLFLFGVLGFLASVAVLLLRPSQPFITAVLAGVLVGTVWAISTEWFQTTVPGRDGSLGDILVDIGGAAAGAAAAWIARRWIPRPTRGLLL